MLLHLPDLPSDIANGRIDPLQTLEMATQDLRDLSHGVVLAFTRRLLRNRQRIDRLNHLR
jgi:hypothetical protein